MRVFRHFSGLPEEARGAVAALGNFDGVHGGHRAVFAACREISGGGPLAAVTFEPHPRSYFRPDDPSFRLTSLQGKIYQLEPLGLDLLYVLEFDEAMAARSPRSFARDVLAGGLGISHVVVGDDFRFGQGRTGRPEDLAAFGRDYGFAVTVMPDVIAPDGIGFSSTRVREHLAAGRPAEAARLLGHPWEIVGRVETGKKLGRTIGFPTANLGLGDLLVPARGVYAVSAGLEEASGWVWRDAVANLGVRPTVDGARLAFEVHIFDFSKDIYGRALRVRMLDFIRPERRFDGLDALKAQIAADCETARRLLADGPAGPLRAGRAT